jgi:hypothetical protein
LRIELRDRGIGPGDDERNARNGRIVGGCDVQRVDVVAPARKHAGYARQRAHFILQQYRDRVSHRPLHLTEKETIETTSGTKTGFWHPTKRVLQCNKN